MSRGKKVMLKTSDDKIFEVDELVAYKSQTLKHLIEDMEIPEVPIPLPNVSSSILSKVIQYCKYHAQAEKWTDEEKPVKVKQWDDGFVDVDQYTLYDLMHAANYLHISPLLDLTCQTIADIVRSQSLKEMRRLFGIQNDFTREEEREKRKDKPWAYR